MAALADILPELATRYATLSLPRERTHAASAKGKWTQEEGDRHGTPQQAVSEGQEMKPASHCERLKPPPDKPSM